jgi:tRNA(Arg) A34 adenosine deaminase TadA
LERELNQRDKRFMERALELAEQAVAAGQEPFGAVVLDRDGVTIGEGHNSVRADLDPTAHGEVVAIRDAWRRTGSWDALGDGTLYSNCEPCLSCSFVILQAGFRRVVFAAYGADVPGFRPPLGGGLTVVANWVDAQPDWAPLEVEGGVMRERAAAQLREFPWSEGTQHRGQAEA